jgi:hypothetical protein
MGRDLARRRIARAEIDAALADMARIAARAEDAVLRDTAMAALIDRKRRTSRRSAPSCASWACPRGRPQPFRVVSGVPAPYRPRDLNWGVVAAVLTAEEKR